MQILSDKTFEASVINHPTNEVWIVMFVSDESNETRDLMNNFRNASDVSAGMVHYGVLDVRRAPKVTQQFEMNSFPCFRIFTADKVLIYNPKSTKPAAFLKATTKFVPDLALNVTESWADDFLGQPAAILFTKSKTTLLWTGISAFFAKKSIRIGICHDESLFSKFKVEQAPAIVFFNGTHREVYSGTMKFKNVREAIEVFFAKRFVEQTFDVPSDEMLMPDQFKEMCIGGKQICVLAATKTPPEGMAVLLKDSARRKLRCFAGVVNLPYKFMEKGGTWIYNPRRDGFIHVTDGANLLPTMDRIIDGTAKWTKRSVYEAGKETDEL
ncbi:hypothetical protein TRFO_35767 [Tritrichomonas foetus]|uniref:Thioredoxin domain-containing protein n=1 Tax=Tritrichomonas foetus TaxID=1144522 RepID=A0A1J4JI34_9EUKA|nr:hypothetical protein TRFO_35767 [Tritrichomonas foetus]|eukprot:OHS97927.1 hypothetical protein TRFO_35767 [Tritrichomonas foetus]